jgi:hypothetical protein
MKPVVQLERTGCGIASVAALAGVSYREMQRLANRLGIFADDPRLWSETDYVRRLLKEFGIKQARSETGTRRSGDWLRHLRRCLSCCSSDRDRRQKEGRQSPSMAKG